MNDHCSVTIPDASSRVLKQNTQVQQHKWGTVRCSPVWIAHSVVDAKYRRKFLIRLSEWVIVPRYQVRSALTWAKNDGVLSAWCRRTRYSMRVLTTLGGEYFHKYIAVLMRLRTFSGFAQSTQSVGKDLQRIRMEELLAWSFCFFGTFVNCVKP